MAGLQAVDYFLWALQRFYEGGEERFLELIWPRVGVVIDLDGSKNAQPIYYTQDSPLRSTTRAKR